MYNLDVGVSFHHGRFVMSLREKARQSKGVECIQASASELIYKDEKVVGVQLNNGTEVHADLVVVADGYSS